jgi:hypothetical protein
MKEFMIAARHNDGSKNVLKVSGVTSHEEAREVVKNQMTTVKTILVCIEGRKARVIEILPKESA